MFVRLLVCSFVRSCDRSFVRLIDRLFARSFVGLFDGWLVGWLVGSLVCLLVCFSLIRLCQGKKGDLDKPYRIDKGLAAAEAKRLIAMEKRQEDDAYLLSREYDDDYDDQVCCDATKS